MDRRKRTRQLIELGGLVKKAGIVEITGDDRTLIFGALLWMAGKLQSEQGDHAWKVWRDWGRAAFEIDAKEKAGMGKPSFAADEERTKRPRADNSEAGGAK
ncbi:MAG: conjugal transfer protein TraD [Pseudomonadota bacterium]